MVLDQEKGRKLKKKKKKKLWPSTKQPIRDFKFSGQHKKY
jgi:hypothetical protein